MYCQYSATVALPFPYSCINVIMYFTNNYAQWKTAAPVDTTVRINVLQWWFSAALALGSDDVYGTFSASNDM